ncbi:MAG: ribonuclease R [Bacteroidetes bacterium]|nr:ribonuclease R [Bacteroidota bacterium]
MKPEKLSFAEKIVLAVLEDTPKGTLNANRVLSRIPREAKLTTDVVYKALLRLANLNKVEQTSKGQFKFKHPPLEITGVIEFTRNGDGFVIPQSGDVQSGDIFVPREWLNHALPGDTVTVEVLQRGNRPKGRIEKILGRALRTYVGVLDVFENQGYLIPEKGLLQQDIKIQGKTETELDGMKALVQVYDYPENSRNPLGRIVDVLGKPGMNDTEMHSIVAEFGFHVHFSAAAEKEAAGFGQVIDAAEAGKRKDFRNTLTFTIDPADAKDFDDAISFKPLKNGHYEIGVHIADVSHYVTPASALDQDALVRGTSVYLADRTIPMLPENLSNHLCSLKPNEDRLAFSAVFEVTAECHVRHRWFGKTVIHSQRRFSYEEAQERIVSGEGDLAQELQTLNTLAKHLQAERKKQGAIGFETEEVRFRMDENGKPLEVYLKKRFDAHKLIEEFMLLANKEVAQYVKTKQKPELPFIYRSHDAPPGDKLIELAKFCKLFGYSLDINSEKNLRHSLNRMLQEVEGKPEADVIQQMAVRTMAKAIYTSSRSDHFGLGFDYYTHFTSPIRRYPDLLAHRLLEQYLKDKPGGYNQDQIEGIAKHSCNTEQKAAEAERASTKYKMAEYLQDKTGQVFEAVVSGVTEWGIYAEIIENHCEGLIRLSDIRGDRWEYYEKERKIVGRRTRRSFHLGDVISIRIKSASPQLRQIDMTLAD